MQPIAADTFTRFRFLSGLRIAPDGAHAALAVSTCQEDQRGYESELWLVDTATGALRPLTAPGKEKRFAWMDGKTILFPATRTEADKRAADAGPYTAFYQLPIDGGEARLAFSVPLRGAMAYRAKGGYLVEASYSPQDDTPPTPDAPKADVQVIDELPFWFNGRGFINKKRTRLYHYNADTNVLRPLTPELVEVGAFDISADGRQVAYAMCVFDSVNPQTEGLYLTDIDTGTTRELLADGTYSTSHLAILGDSLTAAMADGSRFGTSENARIYRIPLAGSAPECIAMPDTDMGGGPGSDCRLGGGISFKADGPYLYLTLGIGHEGYLYRMDASGTLEALTDGQGSLDCFDVQDGKILLIAMRGQQLQELYQLDGGASRPLSKFNADSLNNLHVSTPQPLFFVDTDGVRIDGWVLLPPGYDPASTYPAIFSIHGGPKAVFGEVFHHEMQFWASGGYIVFYCNPRGSGGRGDAFADLRGKYGTIDYDDLMQFMDAVLTAYPAIDPARVCVAGGSYGGFMVNWIIGHTDRFAAAASQRSIANWTSKCLTTDIGYYHNLSQIAGNPWDTPELFWEKSPLKYAPQVKTPTLFIHSTEDYRCWMAEGLQMYAALKMHGVGTRLCLFSGENHELSRSGKPVNRIRRLQEITGWFDEHTKQA